MRTSGVITLLAINLFSVACATKRYVRNEVTPLINHVNDLDDRIGQNTRDLKAVDGRVTQGLNSLTTSEDTTAQNVAAAGQRAGAAQDAANGASTKLTALESTLANVDSYRSLSEKSVQFRSGEKELTEKSQAALDELVAAIPNAPNYLITVEGATDAMGAHDYNIVLSKQRAEAVIRYLASKHNIPSYRMRSIGIGQDKPAAPNNTAGGRAQNRRADVVLLSAGRQPLGKINNLVPRIRRLPFRTKVQLVRQNIRSERKKVVITHML